MEIPAPPPSFSSRSSTTSKAEGPTSLSSSSAVGWEAEYAAYLQSQHTQQEEAVDAPSKIVQQDNKEESSSFSWEAGYAAYCAEKEEARWAADEDARRSETAVNKE